jgi:predicted unusual protein kinase regulating ubiquinone biosynthesis (AarF/ABC1/UbiB family)
MTRTKPLPATVPEGRLNRFLQLGLAAGELAVGGAIEGLRRLAGSGSSGSGSALLSADNARRLAARLSRMRGAAMKLGQIASMHGEDVLPREFARVLAVLAADAAPMPSEQLHRVLGREWGKGWRSRFARFDEEPIAAASIGQVHRARTLDGRELALKIQYPGVARSIAGDVDNAAALLRLFDLLPVEIDVAGLATEAKRQLMQEADYVAEARFLERYRKLVANDGALLVPRVHRDLTTSRIMAMDYVEGVPLATVARSDLPQPRRDRIGETLERLLFRELFEFGVMQTDPNFGNYLYRRETDRIVLLDFGSTLLLDADFVERYRRITRAVVDGDRDAVAREAEGIGYFAPGASREQARATVDVIELVCEPLTHRGRYDFGASDLVARTRDLVLELGIRRALLRSPPPRTLFLHRKLAGSFMLLARLGARIDAHSLVLPFLGGPSRR